MTSAVADREANMRINYNVPAMIANNALSKNDDALSRAIEKLSSGLKINHAKDNPAGLAMSKRIHAQIEGISVATQNASDGISIIETAEGALSEVQDMISRMGELATKASNGTLSDNDRKTINDEVTQLKQECTRLASATDFNGQTLLDGTFDLKGYTDNAKVKVDTYTDSVPTGDYSVVITPQYDVDGNLTSATTATITGTGTNSWTGTVTTSVDEDTLTLTGSDQFGMKFKLSGLTAGVPTTVGVNITGIGAMSLQIGANEGQTLDLRIPTVSLESMGIDQLDVSTKEGAMKAIQLSEDASAYISEIRSRLGAYQNRLEHTSSSLDITSENMTAAYSRVMDVDMATEMTSYTTLQVISQAATSVLAQANERPSQVLQLLK